MNSIEVEWKKFLRTVLTEGIEHEKDDGDIIHEHMINHCFIENILNPFYSNVNIPSNVFLEMIGNGVFNINGYPIKDTALKSYVEQLDQHNQIYLEEYDDSFVYTYPERIFNITEVNRFGEVDSINQFDVICDRLKNNEGSNRAVATLYIAGLDKDETHIPCLQWIQCTVRDDDLVLHVLFRSNDLWSAFPSNMLFLMYLGLKFEEELRKAYPLLKFKGISYTSTSLHIYEGDYEQAKKLMGV